ncbi:molybdenum cofactor biosynthesis protein MoaE [Pseudomonadota bacterium]
MKFSVSTTAIDVTAAKNVVADQCCGALVVFEGWVRNHNEGQQVERLEYEVYRPVAEKEGARIIDEALERFGVSHALCIHREGLLELGEIAVLVCVTSAHRGEAFDACRYIIDQTKTRLPIWKKEHYVSGVSEWVNCEHCAAAGHSHGSQ